MTLRRATPDDLPFLLKLERAYCDLGLLGADDPHVHECRLNDADCRYLIVEEDGAAAGFVILRGLTSNNRCIELKRIAVAVPGRGLGRAVLNTILKIVFEELGAHRLWLDVFDHN